MNNWKKIWERRTSDSQILHSSDKQAIFMELKRMAGFDITEEGIKYDAFIKEHEMIKRNLSCGVHSSIELSSVYEVGCGSGANLFLFEEDGITSGGSDFSNALINIAEQVCHTRDLTCDDAINTPVDRQYDAVMSDCVFHYFPDEAYAEKVLEIMLRKSKFSIGIISVHDTEKKSGFLEHRKRLTENYEELYKDLPKLFYPKTFFNAFAEKHDLHIRFPKYNLPGYWNNDFIFHCFMYKR